MKWKRLSHCREHESEWQEAVPRGENTMEKTGNRKGNRRSHEREYGKLRRAKAGMNRESGPRWQSKTLKGKTRKGKSNAMGKQKGTGSETVKLLAAGPSARLQTTI